MKKILIMALVLISSIARAETGSEGGNGGDPVALDFQRSALDALLDLQEKPELYPELRGLPLRKILKEAQIYVVEEPLPVREGDITQMPSVVNYKNPNRFVIYRAGWLAETNRPERIRRALALHELLGLVGVERTGIYWICQTYLGNSIQENRDYSRQLQAQKRYEREVQVEVKRIAYVVADRRNGGCLPILFCTKDPTLAAKLDPNNPNIRQVFGPTRAMHEALMMMYYDKKWPGHNIWTSHYLRQAMEQVNDCRDGQSANCLAKSFLLVKSWNVVRD